MGTTVRPVATGREMKQFIDLPYRLYDRHPFWIPPLRLDQKEILDRRKHPFYLQAEAEFFLAERDGRVVGRIAAIDNHAYNRHYQARTGFFGFFETENDAATATALLEQAAAWCAARGLDRIQGPVNPSTNYECGLLVEGFDRHPVLMMPYNYEFYPRFIEAAGFAKAKDLLAYWMTDRELPMAKLNAIATKVTRKTGLTIRELRLNRIREELELVFKVYNDAWNPNWGFVPMSREELSALAKNLTWVCDPRIILLAEVEGKPVGFLLAMPELNQVLRGTGGRLLPFGWWKLLRARRRLSVMRVLALGLCQDYQNMGFTAAIYREITTKGSSIGYHYGEIGWVLEDNLMMNRAADMLGARAYKRYRIYERALLPEAGTARST